MRWKVWMSFVFLIVWASLLPAQVILPESGRLAGPLNSQVSEMGDELFNIPDFFVAPLPAAGVELNGWVEIEFGDPQNGTVNFSMHYSSVGAPGIFPFPGGQIYLLFGAQTINQPIASTGTLDLATGEVSNLQVNAFFPQSLMSGMGRLNRFAPLLPGFYPFPDLGVPIGDLPPGFFANEAQFTFDGDGRITGFQFLGRTIFPLAGLAKINQDTGFFPLHAFGPEGTLFVHNPFTCVPGTPPANCPTDENNPDGIPFAEDFFLHPHVFMRTDELREVPVERQVPACGPVDVADGVLVSARGSLYHIGGVRGDGTVIGRVDIFDPETGQWQAGPPLPTPVTEARGAVLGASIYVVGGRRQVDGPTTGLLQVLDTVTGEWQQRASAPTPVANATTAVFGDWLYVLGGKTNRRNGSPAGNLRFTNRAQVYDPPSNRWTEFPMELNGSPIYVERSTALLVGRDIYLIGGRTIDGTVTNRVWLYDILAANFRLGPETLWGTYDATAGVVDKRIFLVGGRRGSDGPSDAGVQFFNIGRTQRPRGSTSLWLAARDQPLATAASAGATLNGEFYLMGGRTLGSAATGPTTRALRSLDPGRGWQVCGTQPIFTPADVFNTASLSVGPTALAPGSLATLTGLNLAEESVVAAPAAAVVPTTLGGVSLTVDGLPAPILAVSPERVDFQVPYGVTTGGNVTLAVQKQGSAQQAPAIEIPMADFSPGIFVQNCGVIRDLSYLDEAAAIACHDDGSLNYAANAIEPGQVIAVQMTGLGPVTPALASGERAPAAPAAVNADFVPTVTVLGDNGQPIEAAVLSAQLAPGEIGVYDVRIEVPADSRVGNRVRVVADQQGVVSNRAMISVGPAAAEAPQPCRRDTDPLFRSCLGPALADLFTDLVTLAQPASTDAPQM